MEAYSTPETILFFWCILRDKVPTREHLTCRSFHGPNWCTVCKISPKSTTHLFLNCSTLITLWKYLSSSIHFSMQWVGENLRNAWDDWFNCHLGFKLQNLPLITSWYVWLGRDRSIHEHRLVCWPHIASCIV